MCLRGSAVVLLPSRERATHLHRDVGESGIGPGRGDGVQAREDSRSLHFQEKTSRLFRGYIDMFLNKKQEASGWPDGVKQTKTKRSTKSTKTKKASTSIVTPLNTMPAHVRCGSRISSICGGKWANVLTVRKPRSCRIPWNVLSY